MSKVTRWMLGGLVAFNLAACGPAGGDDEDDNGGTSVQQQDEDRGDGDGD